MSLLTVSGLSKRFGGVVALSGFDLSIAPGDLLGLIGPNGAGKTTAFNLLTGVLRPSGGRVLFDGADITRASPEARARRGMARTFQNIRLFEDLSVRRNVMAGAHARLGLGPAQAMFGLGARARSEAAIAEAAEAAMEKVGVADLADRRAGEIAYGERRRVEIARALASGPRILLLDEPAAGMNSVEKEALARLITRLNGDGLTIVLVEHNIPMVSATCARLAVMAKGELLTEGPTAEVLRAPEVAEVYLGHHLAGGAAPC